MIASLTSFERDLLRTLTRRVCILTLDQIASGWWPAIRRLQAVRQQLRRLEVAGLVEVDCINAHPLLVVDRPLFAWQPGQPDPDVEVISKATRERWNLPAVPTWVCVALPRAANLFGSTACGLPKMEQRDHDLRLSAVYLHYRKQHPQLARRWVGEHARPKAGYRIKDPDAFLIDRHGRITRLIESAGRYGPQYIERFHDHCVEYDLPYELW